ncbi:MAG: DUF58 domain-containing protein [Bacteroidetes bacterium]|nr:DUF58 domain-containing protein [Bacteroidota bacterium]
MTGLHKSPFHGFSVEFSEHRLYNPGESIRHIDWKLMARSDKTFVKRYEDETNLRCQIIIDGSSSMFYPTEGINKIKFSVYATAAIIHLLRRQRDAFGYTLITDEIKEHLNTKSTQAHQQLIYNKLDELLNQSPTSKGTDLAPALHQLADTITDFKLKLHNICTQYGIDLNEIEVGSDFNQVLMPFFVKRGSMK